MNFEEFFLDSSNDGGARIVADIKYTNSSNNYNNSVLTTPNMFSSSGLSLGLKMGKEGIMGENTESSNIGGRKRSRDEENNDESRSGSDDDGDELNKPPRKKKIYHRHTPHQIQQLESVFKEFPHPDEKQRLELSKRLCLETKQVKFWFQNRRTMMKTQLERHENSLLRQENDKLRAETMSIREALRNPTCTNCGGPAMIGELSFEEQHLRIENMRLKDELDRVCTLTAKFLGRPVTSLPSSVPSSSLELGFGGLKDFPSTLHLPSPDFTGISSPLPIEPYTKSNMNLFPVEKSVYLELALAAMDELTKMTEGDEMLWIRSLEGVGEILNHEEYMRTFNNSCIGMKPNGYVTEATRESGMVIINSLALVETLMDSRKWQDMFPGIIARSSTTDVISNGMGGTRNGVLQLMHAELQVLSPLVPVRNVNFLRFCKQHAEGVWAVVDVSIDTIQEANGGTAFPSCRRVPSGCLVQDMPNGYSKVTWVEHAEYDESTVHQLYRPLISAGMGFGAQRWLATLQRQCEYLAILMSSPRDHTATITPGGRKSMLKLAQRMISNFCASLCASTIHKWKKIDTENVDEEVRVMTRKSVDGPGEPHGIVVSVATSVWLPVSPQRLFDFLRDEGLRSAWDILSNGGPMQEIAHIAKGQDHGNCVSLLRANANTDHHNMLVLQETCIDASGSLVVYAPVDIPAMHVVMNGGDSAYVAVLPSGFAIVPDGHGSRRPASNHGPAHRVSGSLLTVAFQILVNSLPTAKLTVESVETVNNLIFCTVQRIKAALHCES